MSICMHASQHSQDQGAWGEATSMYGYNIQLYQCTFADQFSRVVHVLHRQLPLIVAVQADDL